MIDRIGVVTFLALTFGITYAVEAVLILYGFRLTPDEVPILAGQLVIATVMWVPALATVLTVRFVTHEGFAITNIRLGAIRPYVTSAVLVPVCFAVIYGITWVLGLAEPDWQLTETYSMIASSGADMSSAPAPAVLLIGLFAASVLVAPFINGLFGFGEELGWRGYLLPKLLPLGKPRAYLLLGIIWGLWHAPLIVVGFNYPGYPLLGVVAMMGLATTFGIYLNEMTLRHRSSVLAGWIHGLFNSQAYGVWRVLFPSVNPLLGGITGLVGMTVWIAVGMITARRR